MIYSDHDCNKHFFTDYSTMLMQEETLTVGSFQLFIFVFGDANRKEYFKGIKNTK